MINKLKQNNVLYYIVFGVFAVFYIIRNCNYIDIVTSDEVVYINSAIHLSFPVTNNYNGAVYTLWYFIINKITNDPIITYYINYFFASIISIGAIFYLMLYLKFNKVISLIVCLLLMFSQFNTLLLPKITQIAMIFIVIGIVLIVKTKTLSNKLYYVGLTTLIVAYIRPEYYMAYLATVMLLLLLTIYNINKGVKVEYKRLIIVFVAGVFCYILFNGTPLTNRSFDAFVQHYVRNYCETHHIPHPLSIDGEFKLFKEVYSSKSNSLFGAIMDEPIKFINHVFLNLKNTFFYLFKIINSIFFEGVVFFIPKFVGVIKLIFFLGLLILIDWRKTLNVVSIKVVSNNIVPIALLFFPCIIGLLIVYPREHYLVLLLILIFVGIVGVLSNVRFLPILRVSNANKLLTVLLSILFGFMIFTNYKSKTHYAAMYRLGRDISKKEELVLIDDYFARVYYGEKNQYKLPNKLEINQDFIEFLKINKVKFLHISNSQGLVGISKQKGFNLFVKGFSKYGFVKISITQYDDDYLLIDKDLYKAFEAKKYFN